MKNNYVSESGEVSNVNTTVINRNGFTVTWSEPTESNGDLTKYNVNITTFGHIQQYVVPISSSPKIEVYNLTSGR